MARTVPGVPDWAMRMASLMMGPMSRTAVTVAQYLHNGLNSDIWSMSCRAPRPFRMLAAAPPGT